MATNGPAGSGRFWAQAISEELLLNDSEAWLAAQEARLDQRVLAVLPPEHRDELNLMMQGVAIAGFEVELDTVEIALDAALLTKLTDEQRAELEQIIRGEHVDGDPVDLDALEADLDRNVAP